MRKILALLVGALILATFVVGCSSAPESQTSMEVTVVDEPEGSESTEASAEASSEASAEESSEASADASAEASAATGEAGEVMTAILEDGKLVMLTNAAFPPYEYLGSDNSPAGIDVDIAQAIADELGVELEVVDMDFDGLIPALVSGRGNIVLAGMTVDEERKQSVDFSEPYADATQVLIVPAEGATVTSEDDLTGKTVGVQLGTTGDLLASGMDGVTVQQYKTGLEAAMDLKNGRLDAVMLDQLPSESIVAQNDDLVILPMESTNEQYAAAIAKDNEDLLAVVNGVIERLKSDGTIEEITAAHIEASRE